MDNVQRTAHTMAQTQLDALETLNSFFILFKTRRNHVSLFWGAQDTIFQNCAAIF